MKKFNAAKVADLYTWRDLSPSLKKAARDEYNSSPVLYREGGEAAFVFAFVAGLMAARDALANLYSKE